MGQSTCLSTTTTELKRLGLTATPEGQAALALARAIDSQRSLMALPAMVARLAETLEMLRNREAKGSDSVDELRTRRDAKVSAAG